MGSVLSSRTPNGVPTVDRHHTNGTTVTTSTSTMSSSAANKLRVAIIGGGPGGLATAIALSKVPNVDVHLYEKDAVLREVGAGINISANSWRVLELLGAADSLDTGHQCSVVLNMYVLFSFF